MKNKKQKNSIIKLFVIGTNRPMIYQCKYINATNRKIKWWVWFKKQQKKLDNYTYKYKIHQKPKRNKCCNKGSLLYKNKIKLYLLNSKKERIKFTN